MKKILLASFAVFGLGLTGPAYAANVLYNSWSPTDNYQDGSSYVTNGSSPGQSWAIEFNSGTSTTLTEANVYVTPNPAAPTVTPFVHLSLFSDSAGVPGSSMWSSSSMAAAAGGIDITGIGQALVAGTNYWLAVLPNDVNDSHWQSGDAAVSAALDQGNGAGTSWVAGSNFLPAAIIYGDAPALDTGVPEPASLALLGFGLLGTAAIRRRRK